MDAESRLGPEQHDDGGGPWRSEGPAPEDLGGRMLRSADVLAVGAEQVITLGAGSWIRWPHTMPWSGEDPTLGLGHGEEAWALNSTRASQGLVSTPNGSGPGRGEEPAPEELGGRTLRRAEV